jgi:O-antigen/teichoic acid export membrane protein
VLRPQMKIATKLVIKNSIFNLMGQGLPSLVGIIALPFLIRWLGDERFGLLMIIWAIRGYMEFLSLGLGVALVKFASEAIIKGEEGRLARITWTTTILLGVLSSSGAFALGIFALFSFTKIFHIPPQLEGEVRVALLLTALSVFWEITSIGFRALLRAFQRFDLVNLVYGAGSSLRYLIALILAKAGYHLDIIVLTFLIIQLLQFVIYFFLCVKVSPAIKSVSLDLKEMKPLIWFGGWLSVSQIVGTAIQYMDRFVVGLLLPISHLTYYATPVEIANRFGMLFQSVNRALFPSLAALSKDERALQLYARAMKFMLITVAPIVFLFIFLGQDILKLYVGEDLALKSSSVLQLVAIGILFEALGSIIHNYVLALGYPDSVAKFHLVELLIYTGLAYWFTKGLGIEGMALAWLTRRILEASYVFFLLKRAAPQNIQALISNGMGRALVATGALALFIGVVSWTIDLRELAWVMVCLGMMTYAILIWSKVFNLAERKGLTSIIVRIH